MTRSTNYEKSQRLNRAFDLLANGYTTPRAAEELVGQFGISSRQASRYLLEAQQAGNPVPIAEPTIPMTIKIPQDIALKIRTYAHTHNLTIGDLITHSVLAYLASEGYHG
jgi:predicted DNA-binding transcriptional regulator YafY